MTEPVNPWVLLVGLLVEGAVLWRMAARRPERGRIPGHSPPDRGPMTGRRRAQESEPPKSLIDVQFDREDRSWLSMLGVAGFLAGVFLLLAVSWDRWFPEVDVEAVPAEARVDGPSGAGSTMGDAGSLFGPWLLLGALLTVAGLWMVVRDSRQSATASRRRRGGGGPP